jgi:ABC-type transport system involved in cytochrome c biogenesis permease component
MTFLPIVDRELRVAARRKSTYRIRAWTAVVAVAVGLVALPLAVLGMRSGSLGKEMYTTLTGFTFVLCLLAGVMLMADSLSEEKREGTLGLLFLTDLRGYDVVLGKFIAGGLNAFYGLMAVLPITGLCLLLGGLTAGEFWRTNLALLNTLFFSMAAGVLVSALGRDSQRVMGGTLGLVVLVAGVLPVLGNVAGRLHLPGVSFALGCVSPFYPFAVALEPDYLAQPEKFWWALVASQLFGWCLLALASAALPHCWQERVAARQRGGRLSMQSPCPTRATGARAKTREELLPRNPVLWLMGSEKGFRRIAWIIVGGWAVVALLTAMFSAGNMIAVDVSSYGVRPFGFLLKWLLALQACRFFVEARRSGALEMLLCTPLTSQDIIRGQVLALRRNFQAPVIAMLALLLAPTAIHFLAARGWSSSEAGMSQFALLTGGVYCLRMLADCYALAALGMYLALTLKKPGLASPLTILLVLILPSVLCWLDIFADLFFILWGVSKLRQVDLRAMLAQEYQPVGAMRHLPLNSTASAGRTSDG